MSKRKNIEDMDFEQAYAGLEAAVRALEEGVLPVEASLDSFEKGMAAARQCMKLLDAAEQKVYLLVQEAGAEPVLRPAKLEAK